MLAHWCDTEGAPAAALYLDGDRGLSREGTHGDGSRFPRSLASASSTDLGATARRLDLPGGALVWTTPNPAPPGDPAESPARLLVAAALAILKLRRRVRRQDFLMSYQGVELEALYDVGLAIASTLDLDTLTDEILLRAVSLLDARRGALYLARDQGDENDGDEPPESLLEAHFGGEAAKRVEPGTASAESVHPSILPGAEHLMAVTIAVDGAERGVLVMGDKESRQGVGPFTVSDRRTLGLLANQAAIALENARLHQDALEKERYARDMQLAADIQRLILPRGVPETPGFELHGWNRPAREVGGDYYDFIELGDERDTRGRCVGVILGDVSGKGVPAALMVSTLHSAVRLLLDRIEVGSDLLERLNRHILESSAPNRFITLMVAELDCAARRLTYVNAGHNPGLVLRAPGASDASSASAGAYRVERMPAGGLPVGLLPGSRYQKASLDLDPGDLVCLYSDGITEAEAADGSDEEFGEHRLAALLERSAELALREIVQEIDRAVTEFTGGAPQGDDQTVVLVRAV